MNLTEIETLAQELIKKHLDNHQNGIWWFKWMSSTRALGRCRQPRLGIGEGTIELNEDFVLHSNDLTEIKDVILHEIAHALAGHAAGHGRLWKHYAMSIGARPNRCSDSESFKEVVAQNAKYVATCPKCGQKYYRGRMTRQALRAFCSKHYGMSEETKLKYVINY
jgi:predicted SprT family Zn-dependent metalloprotease